MRRLMQFLIRLVKLETRLNADEYYLARSVDAHDFETRLQTLERRSH